MEWTGLNELREKFLSFYESKGHLRLPSFPLVPQEDKSLLLINSGMAPMKKFFTGEVTPPRKRVTTCQKCIRTPDIERVGKTARHGTYFEMLGNFSFGDYFKHEATAWAWEFVTKVLELPEDRVWVSIYEDDDQAFDIWTKEVGVPADRIVRLGKEDNFWEHGSGPCGPCSELYFDRGEAYGCGSPTCGVGCDCDRYVEFWNLVFTQFDSDGAGHYEPLEHPNIDTGMGLERLACIMQGVGNLFEVDTVQNIMKHVSKIAGVTYGEDEKQDVSLRVNEVESSTDSFSVAGRGEMSLSILMETMRREGYEFQVSPPRVLYQEIDGVKCEPLERLVADVPNDCVGAVMEKIGSRKGEFLSMNPVGSRTKLEFLVPSRGLFGYRNEFLTDTKGEGIMASVFEKYAPVKGEIQRRSTGSLVAFETGEAVTYGLFNAQERGILFIGAGVPVYAGMIVGETPKAEDISVNVCKKKQLTNMRASGSDDALRLTTPRTLSLEQCLEFLADDELLECTPENLRLRKRVLDHGERMKLASRKKG